MKRWLFILGLVLCSSFVLAEVRINEIMYDALGSDNNHEYIEIYADEEVNLTNWVIKDSASNDSLVLLNFKNKENYFLIAEEGFVFSEVTCSVYSAGATIGNGLGNEGDSLELYDDNGTLIDSVSYSNSKAKGNGKSWEFTGSGWEESLADGTPCKENSKAGFGQDYEAVKINEFLPNPIGNDDAAKPQGEWVELYNPTETPMDLKGLVLYDKDNDHELYITDATTMSGTVVMGGKYLLVYRNGDTDFALNNNGFEEVRLFDGYPAETSNQIDSVSYSLSTEGMSWSKVEGDWYKSSATPGEENVRVNGCDWQIEVLPKETIVNFGKNLEFDIVVKRNFGEPSILTVNGTIEDVFGKVVRSYRPWTDEGITTIRTKSYTPNLGEDIYKINFEITDLNCQDQDLSNNVNTRLIVINPQYKVFDSSLEIEMIYLGNDDEAEWGDRVRVKVHIYKGDESKYNVELYAEKDGKIVSKRTKTSCFDKFRDYTLTLPIQLEPNCGGYHLDGDYEMVLKGFDLEDRMDFRIEGFDKELCKGLEETSSSGKQKFSYQILEMPKEVKAGESFPVKLEVIGDGQEHFLKIWSYVYRGPKHYSDEKIKEIKLNENEIQVIDLKIKMDEEVKEGDYKLKVKINKDFQKTNKEITEEIELVGEEKECVVVGESLAVKSEISVNDKLKLLRELNEDGKIVYLSGSQASMKWLPAMIVGVLGLLSVILIFKKI